MISALRIPLLAFSVCLVGCASHRTSIEDYSREGAALDAASASTDAGKGGFYVSDTNSYHIAPKLSDGLAINYANSVERVMRAKFHGNRVTREVAATAQVALAAFSGTSAAFGASTSTVAALGLGSAGIPELQRIFNAKGRAEVYKDAAQMIRRSILEYRSHNPDPDETTLTPNGIILVQRTYGAIDMVDAVLAGQMPSQMEMLEITEAMTRAGTVKHVKGETPVNRISANPSRVADAEALAAANEAAKNERKAFAFAADARQERLVSDDKIKELEALLKEQQELQSAGVAFQDNLLAMEPLSDGISRLQRAATAAGLANKFNFTGNYTTISNAMIDYVHTGANPLKSRIKLAEEIHKQAHP